MYTYICTYTYNTEKHRPTHSQTKEKYPEKELDNTLLNNTKTIPQPLPTLLVINSTDLSEISAYTLVANYSSFLLISVYRCEPQTVPK